MPLVALSMIAKSLSGGCINKVYLVKHDGNYAVLKENKSANKDFFEAEAYGLESLANHGLPVPQVIKTEQYKLYLSYLEPGKPEFEKAGRELALLHLQNQDEFGMLKSNYIGSLVQHNTLIDDWLFFWQEYRLKPILKLMGNPDEELWNNYMGSLDHLLGNSFNASPLHGDLWSGNLHFGQGKAFFIDPAFYYGDAMVDLAMTKLFGDFPEHFFRSYIETGGKYFEERVLHYQVYPILVHAALFGNSYYQQAMVIIKRFIH